MIAKKIIIPTLFVTSIAIAGCGTNDEAGDVLDRSIDGDNAFDQNEAPANRDDEISSQLGYVKYSEDDLDMEDEQNHYVAMDRNKMADVITRLLLRYDGFEEVATLVTDEEVLIAYNRPQNMERDEAATIAKKTALSTLPRFYNVYVSDQAVTFRDIQSLQNSTTTQDNYGNTLDDIIEDMMKAPQGEKVTDENDADDSQQGYYD